MTQPIFDHASGKLSRLDEEVVRAVPPGGNWRDLPTDFGSQRVVQIRESAARGTGSRSTYYGRLRWERPSYTISTYFNRPGNGCFIHPAAARLISIREAARLQGFPDSFRFGGRGRSRFIQVGNAVPPLLAYQLARVYEPGPVVDLFSGVGGLTLGFHWAGFQLVAAVDHDRQANQALATHLDGDGDKVVLADLADPAALRRLLRELRARTRGDGVRVLVGGPPCQGFSTAGFSRPDDPRNQLVHAFTAGVEALRPELVILENVAALLWRSRRPALDAVIGKLTAMGYETSVNLVHTEAFGVPQLRRRVILAASRGESIRWPAPFCRLEEPSYRSAQIGAEYSRRGGPVRTVAEAIADLPARTVLDADDPVSAATPTSRYQRWARGEAELDDLLPPSAIVEEAHLFAA